MKVPFFRLVLVSLLLTQGCSSTKPNTPSTIDQLVIAEPKQINYKSEVAIARLTDVIQRAEVTEEQRAQFFYDRGVIFDSVGLRSLALFDFKRALRLKPDLVEAYNFLGIHYTALQDFKEAYEMFDSALELQPDHEYAYLNRGIALYYGSRSQLAVDDLKLFHEQRPDDPYRLLWLFIAEADASPEKARQELANRASNVSNSVWGKQIIRLYTGNISEQQFIREMPENVRSQDEFAERLCEAYFYLGKLNAMKGDKRTAANFYKLALSTNVYEFVEHRYAKLELELLRQPKVEVASSDS